MRVLFINRFFYPDHSATSQMLTDLAQDLARDGVDVTVITGRQRIDDPSAKLARRERIRGVQVRRVWGTRFGRSSVAGRAVDYLSFFVGAGWRLARECRRGDVVVAKTDPPLISVVAGWVSAWRGAHLVNWLHDLFPEIAERLEVGGVSGFRARFLRARRDRSLARATCNVVIGERMAARLASLEIPARPTAIIHNWCDGEAVRPRPFEGHGLRAAWGLKDRFVVAYSGNMGFAHEFDTILDAARRLREREDIVFLFVGGGVRRAGVEAQARRGGLDNVRFAPYQPRETLGESLTAANAHLVSLLPPLEGLMVPSKFYAAAAAGRPILFIGAEDGELAGLIREGACGYRVAPGEGGALARHVEALAADPALADRLGDAARRLFEQRFDRPLALAAWRRVLHGAAGSDAGMWGGGQ